LSFPYGKCTLKDLALFAGWASSASENTENEAEADIAEKQFMHLWLAKV
jgi:hypothetical protein